MLILKSLTNGKGAPNVSRSAIFFESVVLAIEGNSEQMQDLRGRCTKMSSQKGNQLCGVCCVYLHGGGLLDVSSCQILCSDGAQVKHFLRFSPNAKNN